MAGRDGEAGRLEGLEVVETPTFVEETFILHMCMTRQLDFPPTTLIPWVLHLAGLW